MVMRIATAALLLAAAASPAFAQSASGTNFTTAPAKSAPSAAPGAANPIGEPKVKIPNAAQSSPDTGLRTGEGAATGAPIEVKRIK